MPVRILSKYKHSITCLVAGVFVILLFRVINYTATEGFNPTDDGVVLAQSYRLLQGEIPHLDFISIRPVFSGVMHSIHFFSPLPLLDSARWFVVLQFFIIAMAVTSIVITLSGRSFSVITVFFLQLFLFTAEILNYNLFPWTTLDAVFLSTIGMWIYLAGYNKNHFLKNALAVLLFTLAAISRQNFLLPAVFVSFLVFRRYFWEQRIIKGLLVIGIGWLPVTLYFAMLVAYSALPEFGTQLSGRTELLQTGVLQYVKQWFYSPIMFMHLLIYVLVAMHIIWGKRKQFFGNVIRKYYQGFALIAGVWIVFMLVLHFSRTETNIIMLPFELFWLLIDLLLVLWVVRKPNETLLSFIIITLLIAYTSSISLGDNSPVFAVGMLAGASLLLIHNMSDDNGLFYGNRKLFRFAFISVSILIFVLGVFSQKSVNYRDRGAKQLVYELNNVRPAFGSVRTNAITGAYYKELGNIFDTLPGAINHCVVLPHDAMFYPVFETRNPLPLDWMQPAEFVGNEQRVIESVQQLIQKPGMYFIIDKYDIKKLYIRKVPLFRNDFPYVNLIEKSCQKMDSKSLYFEIYKSRSAALSQR
ncbi:MAG: hypothetical protein KBB11_11345 [Bacteroidales bacterium]|nr:hypothetical protein [Bacteroidales bacterium]HOY39599.1 hypothetical protein [Bacteroidales bacterium]HQP05189.1 hypothetical protein [Bacteroidales bacterium]